MTLAEMQLDIHEKAQRLARLYHRYYGYLPSLIVDILNETRPAHLPKDNFNPNQPRVPAGNPDGGQWTDTGGGGGGRGRSGGRSGGAIDDPPIEPVYPVEEILISILGGRAVTVARSALNFVRTLEPSIRQTAHGIKRSLERGFTDEQVQEAIRTAKKSGQVTVKMGKYRTPQQVYRGTNGVTVIIETSGRNAGKVITSYRH